MITGEQLYCDGGVIGHNPSSIGGTWAWCYVNIDGLMTAHEQDVIPAGDDSGLKVVTNNLTEMLALVRGLQNLPSGWMGTICSDSQITLGRAFLGWKWANIPNWLHRQFQIERHRLKHYPSFRHVLISGHPTRLQLEAGVGKHGYPVSVHNVWCDKACTEAGVNYLKFLETIKGG